MSFVLDNAKYLPCYVTEAGVETLSSGANTIAEIRDRELKGKTMRVQEIALDANADITARIREDNRSLEESSAMSIDHTSLFDLHCKKLFYMNLYNGLAASIDNFPYRFGYWLFSPTVADKVFYDQKLSDEEEGIADEYDIRRLVDEGSLPLPIDTILKRVFKKSTSRTVGWHGDVTTATVGVDVGSEVSAVGKMIAIESVALEKPPLGTYTTALNITVDEKPFLDMRAWACSGSLSDIPLFIPCKDSFSLSLTSNINIAAFDCRYSYSEFKITRFIEMLFSLISRNDDEDLWRRVKSGLYTD